jgi:hypothetical protein
LFIISWWLVHKSLDLIEDRESVTQKSLHLQSVAVKETFEGEAVCDGTLEVFELDGYPKALKACA